MKRLSQLLRGINYQSLLGQADPSIAGLAYHSQRVEPGFLFASMRGSQHDGHTFIPEALERGAAALLVGPQGAALVPEPAPVPVVVAEDVRVALAFLAQTFYDNPSAQLNLIGITGTNGKTTTSHLVEALLGSEGRDTGLIGTLSYKIKGESEEAVRTTPESVDLQALLAKMVQAGVSEVAMEVSSHGLALRRVDGCQFRVAVFTNLSRDHLDFHHDDRQYLKSKLRLFSDAGLAPSGRERVNVINADDPACQAIREKAVGRVITYGVEAKADLRGKEVSVSPEGTSFVAETPLGSIPLRLKLVGSFNVYNALAALAVGLAREVDLGRAAHALEQVEAVTGRFQRVDDGRGCAVVVDYAHTPDGLEKVLTTARELTKGRLIVVFGCGGDRDAGKRPLMGEIAARLADSCVITSDNPRSEEPEAIIGQIWERIPEGNRSRCLREPDRRRAIELAIKSAQPDDLVLIAGKGHETYQIFADRTIHFDDREVAREVLKNLHE